jgi:predicted RNA-binding protein YlxR (DUF448 family)
VATRHSVITDEEESDDFEFEDEELDNQDGEEFDSEEEDEDGSGETEQSGRSNSPTDWESRFRGLQSSLQQSQERAALAQQEAMIAKAEAFKAQLATQDIDPAEADRQFKLWLMGQAVEYQARQNASDREALEHVGRSAYLMQLVNEFGIDQKSKTFERLARIKDPEDMRAFAEEVSTLRKQSTKQTNKAVRKAKGSDRFDSGGGRVGTPPKKKAKNLDDAASVFSKFKIEF